MAISFIGSTGGGSLNGGNVTLTLPGTYSAGDVAVIAVTLGCSKTTTLAVRSSIVGDNYTQIVSTITSSNARFGVFTDVLPSTAITQAVVTGTGGSTDSTTAVIMVFRGCELSTQNGLDVTPTSTTGSATNPNSPSLTPVSCSDVYITCVGQSVTTALTAPTSWQSSAQATGADTNPAATAMAWITNATTAALDPAAWTGATPQWCSATVALKPSLTWASVFGTGPGNITTDKVEEDRRVIVKSYG